MQRTSAPRRASGRLPRETPGSSTRLGNVLRAAEGRVALAPGESPEGYIIRHHAETPENIRNEHHDYRTCLDIYSSLVLIFAVPVGRWALGVHEPVEA